MARSQEVEEEEIEVHNAEEEITYEELAYLKEVVEEAMNWISTPLRANIGKGENVNGGNLEANSWCIQINHKLMKDLSQMSQTTMTYMKLLGVELAIHIRASMKFLRQVDEEEKSESSKGKSNSKK